jgi:sodium/proline symporter
MGALAGIVVGALTVVLWPMTGSALYEMVPGVAFASVAIVAGSLLDRPAPAHIQLTHEAVHAELRADGY